jgi:myosin heavy subunit
MLPFQVLGFTPDMQLSVWRTLAGILLLGNVEFEPINDHQQEGSIATDVSLVARIANAWRVNKDDLLTCLSSRTFATGAGNKSTMYEITYFRWSITHNSR